VSFVIEPAQVHCKCNGTKYSEISIVLKISDRQPGNMQQYLLLLFSVLNSFGWKKSQKQTFLLQDTLDSG